MSQLAESSEWHSLSDNCGDDDDYYNNIDEFNAFNDLAIMGGEAE